MTNDMEDKDLNLAIAKQRGVLIINYRQTDGTAGMLTEEIIPDYINNPALNRELELELLQAGLSLHQPAGKEYYWAEKGYQWFQGHSIEAVDLDRATAQAYHKQFIGGEFKTSSEMKQDKGW